MQTMYPGMPNSPSTELATAITSTQTTITVLNGSVLPIAPNIATIGGEGELAETFLYTTKSGNTLSGITRGVQGSARAWDSGIGVARNFTEADYAALIANIINHDEQLTGASATPSADRIAMYDASGRLQSGAAPTSNNHVVRKVELDAVNTEMETVKQSVSNGKVLVAGAITDKRGILTPADAPFQQMADDIAAIITDPSGDATAIAADLLSGKTAYSQYQKITGTMPNRTGHVTGQSISRSGTTLRIRPQAGRYPADTANSVQWSDPNWIAANILKDKSIFGLLGTLEPKYTANGQVTSSSSTTYFARGNGTSVSFYYVQVSGLDFIPEIIILSGSTYDITFSRTSDYLYYESSNYYSSILAASGGYQTEIRMTSPAYVDARGFLLPVSKSQNFKWTAFG